jgi:hypothetical protein
MGGGLRSFVKKGNIYIKIDILHHCKQQVLEIYAVQLETKASASIYTKLVQSPFR